MPARVHAVLLGFRESAYDGIPVAGRELRTGRIVRRWPADLFEPMSLRIAKLLLALLPTFGAAQTLPNLAPHAAPGGTPLVDELLAVQPSTRALTPGSAVLPIWSGTNGELLAVVALPQGWANSPVDPAPAYGGPSAWHLVGSETAGAGGLQWQSGNGLHAEALFGQYLAPSASACGVRCDVSDPAHWATATLTGSIGMGWSDASSGLDLSYGLSWLQSQRSSPMADTLVTGGGLVPVLAIPNAGAFGLDSEASLYARGRWAFGGHGPALDVSASYGRSRLSALGSPGALPGAAAFLPGIDLDQLSLSLGLDAGSLRGAIVGHVIGSDDPLFAGKRWTTLDLGVSWRTPWSGELSVGAQNLLNTPINAQRDGDGQQSRTPYIQYRQDL